MVGKDASLIRENFGYGQSQRTVQQAENPPHKHVPPLNITCQRFREENRERNEPFWSWKLFSSSPR